MDIMDIKIANENCDLEIIKSSKNNKIYIIAQRTVQKTTGGKSFLGYYGSMPCYEDDYDEFKISVEIELNYLIEELEELSYFVNEFKVDITTVFKVDELFDFIFYNTEYWEKIDDFLCKYAQESVIYD